MTHSVGDYEQLIRRASFLYADRDRRFVKLLLEHLRDVRNRLVHGGEVRSNIEMYVYQLKSITELIIQYHLRRGTSYSSLPALAEYMDTPTDRGILERRIRDYRRVLLRFKR